VCLPPRAGWICVAWRPELTVNAAVEVACWCAPDHNVHQVREGHWPATTTEELVEAFDAGIAILAGALDSGQFDPRSWRHDAGLPDAPPPSSVDLFPEANHDQ
jgi:hypothetical protein